MARADSHRAIGGVSALLQEHLTRRGFNATIGRPEAATEGETAAKLNLFLYETVMDGSMRNIVIDPDAPPPLWLTLRYLLTAFDDSSLSDSIDAHELLGQGMMALHDLNFLRLDDVLPATLRRMLEANPEPLKITFDDASPELLSKLMQGPDDTYRVSTAFQVRPVLLMSSRSPAPAPLVGVDLTVDPAATIGLAGLGLEAIPSLGSRIDRVEPEAFEPGATITLFGTDLAIGTLEAMLDGHPLRVVAQSADRVQVQVASTLPTDGPLDQISAGRGPSAGERGLSLRQPLPNGRFRGSNVVGVALLPVVTQATLAAGVLTIDGTLLGGGADEVIVIALRDGLPLRVFDTVVTQPDQRRITISGVVIPVARIGLVVRVNGQTARQTVFVMGVGP